MTTLPPTLPPTPPTLTLLRNGHLYTPDDAGIGDVLLAGNQVAAVGRDLALPPANWPCRVVDLQGARVVPGLIDAHVHLTGGGGEAGSHTRVPAVRASALAAAGVTTVVGLLGTDGTTRTVAESLACARTIEHYGITAFCYTGSYQIPLTTLTGSVRGDLVHNDRLVAVGELAIADHRSSQPTLDEILRIASDCHVAGMMTGKAGLLHLHVGDGVRGLELVRQALETTELPARTFHPTHCNRQKRLWREAMALHKDRGIYVDVTTFEADADSLDAVQAVQSWLENACDPARLTLSSDGGGCLPTFDGDGVLMHMDVGDSAGLLASINQLVQGGMPLATVLPMVTRNVATLFRFTRKGRIEAGADADVLVLGDDGRPLHLWAGGQQLVADGNSLIREMFAR
jgi:beta-aspartyl-dipeptidase (metallo-type)